MPTTRQPIRMPRMGWGIKELSAGSGTQAPEGLPLERASVYLLLWDAAEHDEAWFEANRHDQAWWAACEF